MAEVSIPINQTGNINQTENHNKNPQSSLRTFLKITKLIITIIVGHIAFFAFVLLILLSSQVFKTKSEMRQAFAIDVLTLTLNGVSVLFTLSVAHTRIIPFITVTKLLLKSKEENFTQSTYYIKKQNIIKKYVSWYDDQYVSLSYLLLVYALWMFNMLCQVTLTITSWTFSTYKNGVVVLSMISPEPRPMTVMIIFIVCAISSSITTNILVRYKMYQIKKLRKLESPIEDDSAV